MSWRDEPATEKQIYYLRSKNIIINGITKGQASEIIKAFVTFEDETNKRMRNKLQNKKKVTNEYYPRPTKEPHKKCPFCGGTPTLVEHIITDGTSYSCDFRTYMFVRCNNCSSQTQEIYIHDGYDDGDTIYTSDDAATKEDVWQSWDKRSRKR